MAETQGVQLRDLGVCACPCHPVQGNLRRAGRAVQKHEGSDLRGNHTCMGVSKG